MERKMKKMVIEDRGEDTTNERASKIKRRERRRNPQHIKAIISIMPPPQPPPQPAPVIMTATNKDDVMYKIQLLRRLSHWNKPGYMNGIDKHEIVEELQSRNAYNNKEMRGLGKAELSEKLRLVVEKELEGQLQEPTAMVARELSKIRSQQIHLIDYGRDTDGYSLSGLIAKLQSRNLPVSAYGSNNNKNGLKSRLKIALEAEKSIFDSISSGNGGADTANATRTSSVPPAAVDQQEGSFAAVTVGVAAGKKKDPHSTTTTTTTTAAAAAPKQGTQPPPILKQHHRYSQHHANHYPRAQAAAYYHSSAAASGTSASGSSVTRVAPTAAKHHTPPLQQERENRPQQQAVEESQAATPAVYHFKNDAIQLAPGQQQQQHHHHRPYTMMMKKPSPVVVPAAALISPPTESRSPPTSDSTNPSNCTMRPPPVVPPQQPSSPTRHGSNKANSIISKADETQVTEMAPQPPPSPAASDETVPHSNLSPYQKQLIESNRKRALQRLAEHEQQQQRKRRGMSLSAATAAVTTTTTTITQRQPSSPPQVMRTITYESYDSSSSPAAAAPAANSKPRSPPCCTRCGSADPQSLCIVWRHSGDVHRERSFCGGYDQFRWNCCGRLDPQPCYVGRHDSNGNNAAAEASGNAPAPFLQVVCHCHRPASLRRYRKDGPNVGRCYFRCNSHGRVDSCNFFHWADVAYGVQPSIPNLAPLDSVAEWIYPHSDPFSEGLGWKLVGGQEGGNTQQKDFLARERVIASVMVHELCAIASGAPGHTQMNASTVLIHDLFQTVFQIWSSRSLISENLMPLTRLQVARRFGLSKELEELQPPTEQECHGILAQALERNKVLRETGVTVNHVYHHLSLEGLETYLAI